MSLFSELYKKAYDLFNIQNYAEAQTVLNKAEAVYEDENAENINREDIEILRGSIALSQNDIENARDAFENALKQNNKSAEACMGLGQIFYLDGMKNEAKSMFEWAVNNEPDNKAAESNLSKINSELGFPASHNSLVGNIDEVDSEYDFSSIYEPYTEKRGACYYYINGKWVRNENYGDVPKIKIVRPSNVLRVKDMYSLVNEIDKLEFLVKPQKHMELFKKCFK